MRVDLMTAVFHQDTLDILEELKRSNMDTAATQVHRVWLLNGVRIFVFF